MRKATGRSSLTIILVLLLAGTLAGCGGGGGGGGGGIPGSPFAGTWQSEGITPAVKFTVGDQLGTATYGGVHFTYYRGRVECPVLPSGAVDITSLPGPDNPNSISSSPVGGVTNLSVVAGAGSENSVVCGLIPSGSRLYGGVTITQNGVQTEHNGVYFHRVD